tara:strand:- start:167 stop:562 length:396 start_codon:yes stop_codon:yes gene_type:complete
MKIEKFDRNNVNKILNPELLEALIPVAEKYGLKVHSKGGGFHTYKWNVKFEFVAPEGAAESDNEIGKRLGAKFDVGFEWTSGGKTYRVTGFNPSKPKNDTEVLRLHDGAELHCSHNLPNMFVKEVKSESTN